jgi:aminoglycoside phosphotransferase (APT) family kinase protein
MVDGDRASVIDWTDAGIGPREADVARTALLFHVAKIAASSTVERQALRLAGPWLSKRYLRAYRKGASLDAERMRVWEVLHGVHGWAQVEMLHAGGFDGASSAEASSIPVEVGEFLEQVVTSRLG